MTENREGPEQPRSVAFVLRMCRVAGPALDWVAFTAALQSREGLAVAAKALAVLIPLVVRRLEGGQHH